LAWKIDVNWDRLGSTMSSLMRNLVQIFVLFIIVLLGLQNPDHLTAGSESTLIKEINDLSGNTSPKVTVFYFHRKFRCPSCVVVEDTVSEALPKLYPSEMKEGTVSWQVVNIDSMENRHYYDDFNLLTNSLVVVDSLNGRVQHFRVLEKVWEIYADRQAVFDLVKTEVTACLNGD
jgi:hypothetical protein